MNRILVILSIVLPLTVACQKSDDTTLTKGTNTTAGTIERPKLVRTADGRYMASECLSQNAKAFDSAYKSGGLESAKALMDKFCNVRGMAAEERKRHCAPTCYVGSIPWTSYYYPPSYYNNQQTNVNLTFNNYFFGGNQYSYNGYQMLGYNPQQQYNPYPQGYQPYPQYNQQVPYNYNNYNYGGQYQQGQPFYYNTNYYNQAPSNQFCNTMCANGNGVGCANTCWYGGQSSTFGYPTTNTGATVIQ